MKIYYLPIEIALITFPVIMVIFALPYMVIQYHKFGAISFTKTFFLALFVLYLLCAYYLVILPLPSPDMVANLRGPTMQLMPFHYIHDIIEHSVFDITNIKTFIPAFKQSYFIQPLFNVFLTIPFGMFISYYFNQNLKKVIKYTLLLSLFFEITQLSGLYHLYPRPYRLFDIDDLCLNTLGGMFGYYLFNILKDIIPSKSILNEKALLRSNHISYLRRFIAYIIDLFIINIFAIIIKIFTLSFFNIAFSNYINTFLLFIIYYYIYFVIIQYFFDNTIGKRLVKIKTLFTYNRLISLLLKYTFIILLMPFGILYELTNHHYFSPVLYLIIIILFIINCLVKAFTNKELCYEKLSNTININMLDNKQ